MQILQKVCLHGFVWEHAVYPIAISPYACHWKSGSFYATAMQWRIKLGFSDPKIVNGLDLWLAPDGFSAILNVTGFRTQRTGMPEAHFLSISYL